MRRLEGVGFTALVTARARARESSKAEPLFVDRFAARFVAAAGPAAARLGPAKDDGSSHLWHCFFELFTVRTPFFDEHLVRYVSAGTRQVVILGAGLDARAFRLDLPTDTVLYEVDTPAVHEFKTSVVVDEDPRGKRVPVATDLRDDWPDALLSAGFSPDAPTVWLAEGLFMYFDADSADRLLAAVTGLSARGSSLVAETIPRPPRMDDIPDMDADDRALAQLFVDNCQPGPAGTPAEWMARHGWQLDVQTDIVDLITGYGRAVPRVFDPTRPDPYGDVLSAGSLR